jgi:hypothetical protein
MNDTDARREYGFFSPSRAEEIIEAHEGQRMEATFQKRTNGEWRTMVFRFSKWLSENRIEVVEILEDAHEQGDLWDDSEPPTQVRQIPTDAITRLETDHLIYTP